MDAVLVACGQRVGKLEMVTVEPRVVQGSRMAKGLREVVDNEAEIA